MGDLLSRRQQQDGWLYQVELVFLQNSPTEPYGSEAAEVRVWLRPGEQAFPVPGTDYEGVPTTRLPPASFIDTALGPRRPPGWVLAKGDGRASRATVHAVDCEEAPAGAPTLSLDQALNAAEDPRVRVCAVCGAVQELDFFLHESDPDSSIS
ncbi:DUF6233 domain-containing protein [Streptomyces sp. GZWMJZ-114]|uniref:DUF6233 domain-containing protein n=1 Tax=Streptomyces sp. GZWMJZ-114 TaxID=2494734 RepID=UPI001F50AB78|nr:DUF6233 domain-containing protein [Streptomyces sp. GZWMJZ-114]